MPTVSKSDLEHQLVNPRAVALAKKNLPNGKDTSRASELLKAVADPTRMRILSALRAADELCVYDIAAVVMMSESAVSHQLRLLRTVDLVKPRKDGRLVFYRLSDGHVASILNCALEHARE
jgi:ArsR family transcriptional regulator, lead/cadmium/zinc/bismuth-responsive transcriptional repressor